MDKGFLTVGEVVNRIRAAGLPANPTEVIKLVDAGVLAHYRSETSGHRRVPVEAVDRLIQSRREQLAASGWVA